MGSTDFTNSLIKDLIVQTKNIITAINNQTINVNVTVNSDPNVLAELKKHTKELKKINKTLKKIEKELD